MNNIEERKRAHFQTSHEANPVAAARARLARAAALRLSEPGAASRFSGWTASTRVILKRLSKSVLLGFGFALLAHASALAESVTLGWNPSPDPTVVGFYVYYGTESHVYTERIDTGASTSVTVTGLKAGKTYYFAVSAYTAEGFESLPSQEIVYAVPAAAAPAFTGELRMISGPVGDRAPRLLMRVPPKQPYQVYTSSDLKSWERIHNSVSLTTNWQGFVDHEGVGCAKRFYRLALPDAPPVPGILSIKRGAYPAGARGLRPEVIPGEHYEIQVSVDFVNWTTIQDATCAGEGPMELVETGSTGPIRNYYRVQLAGQQGASSVRALDIRDVRKGNRLSVAVLPGQRYRVEYTEDFETWTTLHEAVSLSVKPVDLADPNAARSGHRFYRLVFE